MHAYMYKLSKPDYHTKVSVVASYPALMIWVKGLATILVQPMHVSSSECNHSTTIRMHTITLYACTCAYMPDQQFCYTQRKYKPRSVVDSLP